MTVEEYNISVNQIGPSLLRFVNSNLRDKDHSKDIVQDAYIVLWDKRHDVIIEKAKSFLFSVAHYKMLDFFRKKGNKQGTITIEIYADDQYKSYSQKNLLNYAIGRLSFEYRELITLRDLEGYNYKEIGQITGLNESKVKVYLFRARIELKKILTEVEVLSEK